MTCISTSRCGWGSWWTATVVRVARAGPTEMGWAPGHLQLGLTVAPAGDAYVVLGRQRPPADTDELHAAFTAETAIVRGEQGQQLDPVAAG